MEDGILGEKGEETMNLAATQNTLTTVNNKGTIRLADGKVAQIEKKAFLLCVAIGDYAMECSFHGQLEKE